MGERLLRSRVNLCLVVCLGGCCVAPPLPEKFFNREHPEHTLNGFVYAVDTHQWDYAYASLSESSQEEISRFKFAVAIRVLKDPVFHQPIFDIISNAVPDYGQAEFNAGSLAASTLARIVVVSTVRDDGKRIDFQAWLFFEKDEGGEWRFDFLESADNIQRQVQQANSPPVEDVTRR